MVGVETLHVTLDFTAKNKSILCVFTVKSSANKYLCSHERGYESGDIENCVAGDCRQHHGAAAGTGGYRYRGAPG